ncbi:MAG TPA: class I SAM-dependent methyltransferase [Azospirillum sp.]
MPKPIFTGEFVAFSPSDRVALGQLIRKVARPNCRMAEIGSWLGNGSTQVFLSELAVHDGSNLLCVDTWRGNPNVPRHQTIVAEYDVFATFRSNVAAAASPVNVQFLVADSTQAAPWIADGGFDLVFIDADHSYGSVQADIAAWRGKVKAGGILCGHDCESRVTPATRAHLMEHRQSDAIPGDGTPFAMIHPGSILAVDEAFGGQAELCSEHPVTLGDGSFGRSTIWFATMA